VTEYDTTGPHPVESGEIPLSSTTFSVAGAERERFPAKEEAAGAILAGITILWMVNRTAAPNLS
jgi:hypothetical protein